MTTDEVKQCAYEQREREMEFKRIQVEKNLLTTKYKKNYYIKMILLGLGLAVIPLTESRMFAAGIFMYMIISKKILTAVNNMELKRRQICMYIFPIAAIMFVCTLLISGEFTTHSFETTGSTSDLYRIGGTYLLWKAFFFLGIMLTSFIGEMKDKKIEKIRMR